MMQPDSTKLIETIGIHTPLIGLYDAPDVSKFNPVVTPEPDNHICVFSFYENWLNGETLHITKENFGCGGAATYLCGTEIIPRELHVQFLIDGEGLKASHALMNQWFDHNNFYSPEHSNILIGPLREDQHEYLKSISFFVNPDQLSALMLGAEYNKSPKGPPAVIAPFGSGCMLLVTLFNDLNISQAIIGETDIAARQFLPPDILAFTVTKPMFRQLCKLDERSFLYKQFLKDLRKVRGLI